VAYTPSGNPTQHLSLEEPARFSVVDVSTAPDPTSGHATFIEFDPSEKQRRHDWTSARMGRQLAILLNGRVVTVATIQAPLQGALVLTEQDLGQVPTCFMD
jgi:preprotein translocase subunit SecD